MILHEQDYDRLDDRYQVQKKLQQVRPEYEKAGAKVLDYEEIISRVREAENRSQNQLCRREYKGKPHGRPSTKVDDLTKAIWKVHEAVITES